MAKVFKRLILVVIAGIVIALALLWTPDTDPAEMKAKYGSETSQYVSDANGMAIHYRDEGNPNGRPIVLFHGSGASLHTWEDMIVELSDEFRLISFDFPGHGLTGPDPERDYSASSLLEAAQTVLDEVGVERAIIAGNSMGGWAAWRLALASPEMVEGLVLIDASGPQIDDKPNPYLAARIVNSPVGQLIAPKIAPRSMVKKTLSQVRYDDDQITDELVDRYWELARYPGNRQAMVDRGKVDRGSHYWDRISEIEVPVLILWGKHDVTTPPSFARAFDMALKDARNIMYYNAAHLPMEEVPDQVAKDIRDWTHDKFVDEDRVEP